MRKALALLVLLAAVTMIYHVRPERPTWTTESEEARQAMEAGLDAFMKFYTDEARRHFERAVELDPGFLVAKERLGRQSQSEQRLELARQLRQADLSTVTPRERFLIRYWLAQQVDRNAEEAAQILDQRLRRAPEDPFALQFAAGIAIQEGDREQAERLLQEVIDLEPNWVVAQNQLGYMAMEDGDFRQAEEHFQTYQYIAPDQANPHDSMGELLLLVGRYDEAQRELEKALELRPTFAASYNNLLWVAILERDTDAAQTVLDRMEATVDRQASDAWHGSIEDAHCLRNVHLGWLTGDWIEAWTQGLPCLNLPIQVALVHRAGLIVGLDGDATRLRGNYVKWLETRGGESNTDRVLASKATLLHIDGNARLARGETAAATELFRQADRQLRFASQGQALFKLYNLGQLAATLDFAAAGSGGGNTESGEVVWRRIAAVNPRIRPFLEAGARPLLLRPHLALDSPRPHSRESRLAGD